MSKPIFPYNLPETPTEISMFQDENFDHILTRLENMAREKIGDIRKNKDEYLARWKMKMIRGRMAYGGNFADFVESGKHTEEIGEEWDDIVNYDTIRMFQEKYF